MICCLNVKGLSNDLKRRETLNWLRNKKYSVYFLQEVHSSKETEKLWSAEWGYTVMFKTRAAVLYRDLKPRGASECKVLDPIKHVLPEFFERLHKHSWKSVCQESS